MQRIIYISNPGVIIGDYQLKIEPRIITTITEIFFDGLDKIHDQ